MFQSEPDQCSTWNISRVFLEKPRKCPALLILGFLLFNNKVPLFRKITMYGGKTNESVV